MGDNGAKRSTASASRSRFQSRSTTATEQSAAVDNSSNGSIQIDVTDSDSDSDHDPVDDNFPPIDLTADDGSRILDPGSDSNREKFLNDTQKRLDLNIVTSELTSPARNRYGEVITEVSI